MSGYIWIESYECAVDDKIAYPVRNIDSTHAAIKRGMVRRVSLEEALSINQRFQSQGSWARDYLKSKLEERMDWLNAWAVNPLEHEQTK